MENKKMQLEQLEQCINRLERNLNRTFGILQNMEYYWNGDAGEAVQRIYRHNIEQTATEEINILKNYVRKKVETGGCEREGSVGNAERTTAPDSSKN